MNRLLQNSGSAPRPGKKDASYKHSGGSGGRKKRSEVKSKNKRAFSSKSHSGKSKSTPLKEDDISFAFDKRSGRKSNEQLKYEDISKNLKHHQIFEINLKDLANIDMLYKLKTTMKEWKAKMQQELEKWNKRSNDYINVALAPLENQDRLSAQIEDTGYYDLTLSNKDAYQNLENQVRQVLSYENIPLELSPEVQQALARVTPQLREQYVDANQVLKYIQWPYLDQLYTSTINSVATLMENPAIFTDLWIQFHSSLKSYQERMMAAFEPVNNILYELEVSLMTNNYVPGTEMPYHYLQDYELAMSEIKDLIEFLKNEFIQNFIYPLGDKQMYNLGEQYWEGRSQGFRNEREIQVRKEQVKIRGKVYQQVIREAQERVAIFETLVKDFTRYQKLKVRQLEQLRTNFYAENINTNLNLDVPQEIKPFRIRLNAWAARDVYDFLSQELAMEFPDQNPAINGCLVKNEDGKIEFAKYQKTMAYMLAPHHISNVPAVCVEHSVGSGKSVTGLAIIVEWFLSYVKGELNDEQSHLLVIVPTAENIVDPWQSHLEMLAKILNNDIRIQTALKGQKIYVHDDSPNVPREFFYTTSNTPPRSKKEKNSTFSVVVCSLTSRFDKESRFIELWDYEGQHEMLKVYRDSLQAQILINWRGIYTSYWEALKKYVMDRDRTRGRLGNEDDYAIPAATFNYSVWENEDISTYRNRNRLESSFLSYVRVSNRTTDTNPKKVIVPRHSCILVDEGHNVVNNSDVKGNINEINTATEWAYAIKLGGASLKYGADNDNLSKKAMFTATPLWNIEYLGDYVTLFNMLEDYRETAENAPDDLLPNTIFMRRLSSNEKQQGVFDHGESIRKAYNDYVSKILFTPEGEWNTQTQAKKQLMAKMYGKISYLNFKFERKLYPVLESFCARDYRNEEDPSWSTEDDSRKTCSITYEYDDTDPDFPGLSTEYDRDYEDEDKNSVYYEANQKRDWKMMKHTEVYVPLSKYALLGHNFVFATPGAMNACLSQSSRTKEFGKKKAFFSSPTEKYWANNDASNEVSDRDNPYRSLNFTNKQCTISALNFGQELVPFSNTKIPSSFNVDPQYIPFKAIAMEDMFSQVPGKHFVFIPQDEISLTTSTTVKASFMGHLLQRLRDNKAGILEKPYVFFGQNAFYGVLSQAASRFSGELPHGVKKLLGTPDANKGNSFASGKNKKFSLDEMNEIVNFFYGSLTPEVFDAKNRRYVFLGDTYKRFYEGQLSLEDTSLGKGSGFRSVPNASDTDFWKKIMFLTFNHERNDEGEFIKIAFGDLTVREGISLFEVKSLHFPIPVSGSLKEQATGRVMRRCSHKKGDPVTWVVHVFVYINVWAEQDNSFDIYNFTPEEDKIIGSIEENYAKAFGVNIFQQEYPPEYYAYLDGFKPSKADRLLELGHSLSLDKYLFYEYHGNQLFDDPHDTTIEKKYDNTGEVPFASEGEIVCKPLFLPGATLRNKKEVFDVLQLLGRDTYEYDEDVANEPLEKLCVYGDGWLNLTNADYSLPNKGVFALGMPVNFQYNLTDSFIRTLFYMLQGKKQTLDTFEFIPMYFNTFLNASTFQRYFAFARSPELHQVFVEHLRNDKKTVYSEFLTVLLYYTDMILNPKEPTKQKDSKKAQKLNPLEKFLGFHDTWKNLKNLFETRGRVAAVGPYVELIEFFIQLLLWIIERKRMRTPAAKRTYLDEYSKFLFLSIFLKQREEILINRFRYISMLQRPRKK
jgi:hypothetical protein